jgi:lipoprotein-releasing system permease protein
MMSVRLPRRRNRCDVSWAFLLDARLDGDEPQSLCCPMIEKVTMFVILALIMLVAAFNIVSTLIMMVMEKLRNIAILKAMVATKRAIMIIFVLQELMIGMAGTVEGAIGGVVLASSLEPIGGFLEGLLQMNVFPKDVYYFDQLPANL